MGAWDADSLSNDDAMDWLDGLSEMDSGWDYTRSTFEVILEAPPDQPPDASDCGAALAAAELVAAAVGRPSKNWPEEARQWLSQNPPGAQTEALKEAARQAVRRIGLSSELRELWEDSGDFEVWQASLADLSVRLR